MKRLRPFKNILLDSRLYERFADIMAADTARFVAAPQLTRRLMEMGWAVEVPDGSGGLKVVVTEKGLKGYDKQKALRLARLADSTFDYMCMRMVRAREKRKRRRMDDWQKKAREKRGESDVQGDG